MSAIEHVAIFADDLERARRFYVDALGMQVIVDNSKAAVAGYFLAGPGGSALEIIARPPGVAAVNPRYAYHVAFAVDDFDATRADLARRGVTFEPDTEINSDTFRTAFFADPEGNRCQIVWRREPLGR